eukprot:TRINITY_DN66599_c0_g4_i1.p1 TRINITY_DN66599_c0_g4~~TRINITY_DN66599_c0_g4_i1.p1  ORF type:complete len:524 (-),score=45.74 TRINITY_DN66599_c0_g4_i1:141-1712(-)
MFRSGRASQSYSVTFSGPVDYELIAARLSGIDPSLSITPDDSGPPREQETESDDADPQRRKSRLSIFIMAVLATIVILGAMYLLFFWKVSSNDDEDNVVYLDLEEEIPVDVCWCKQRDCFCETITSHLPTESFATCLPLMEDCASAGKCSAFVQQCYNTLCTGNNPNPQAAAFCADGSLSGIEVAPQNLANGVNPALLTVHRRDCTSKNDCPGEATAVVLYIVIVAIPILYLIVLRWVSWRDSQQHPLLYNKEKYGKFFLDHYVYKFWEQSAEDMLLDWAVFAIDVWQRVHGRTFWVYVYLALTILDTGINILSWFMHARFAHWDEQRSFFKLGKLGWIPKDWTYDLLDDIVNVLQDISLVALVWNEPLGDAGLAYFALIMHTFRYWIQFVIAPYVIKSWHRGVSYLTAVANPDDFELPEKPGDDGGIAPTLYQPFSFENFALHPQQTVVQAAEVARKRMPFFGGNRNEVPVPQMPPSQQTPPPWLPTSPVPPPTGPGSFSSPIYQNNPLLYGDPGLRALPPG